MPTKKITRRWLYNSFLVILIFLSLIIIAFSLAIRSYYYNSVLTVVRNTASVQNASLVNYSEDNTVDFSASVRTLVENFADKDRMELMAIDKNGTVIIKFFLNVSKAEQKKRFMERLNDESKNWKFSSADVKERQYWDDYMKAYSDVLTETSTEIAPWYVIPADNKWFMRYAVGQIICERMEKLDLHYPQLSKEALERLEECKKNVSDINF